MGKDRFKPDWDREREDILIVKEWLNRNHLVDRTTDATEYEQREQHFDFHGYLYGELTTFEAKTRRQDFPDLLIETLSCIERKTPGWIYTTQAKILVYTLLLDNVLKKIWLLNFPKLYNWWLKEGSHHRIEANLVIGRTDNLYRTENYAIRWEYLPRDIIMFSWSDF